MKVKIGKTITKLEKPTQFIAAHKKNTANIYISTRQPVDVTGIRLRPGESIAFDDVFTGLFVRSTKPNQRICYDSCYMRRYSL